MIDLLTSSLAAVKPSLWGDLVSGLVSDVQEFVSDNQADILSLLLEEQKASEVEMGVYYDISYEYIHLIAKVIHVMFLYLLDKFRILSIGTILSC